MNESNRLPEGRKPLPKEWFIDRAEGLIKPMTDEERQRAKEREEGNRSKDE